MEVPARLTGSRCCHWECRGSRLMRAMGGSLPEFEQSESAPHGKRLSRVTGSVTSGRFGDAHRKFGSPSVAMGVRATPSDAGLH